MAPMNLKRSVVSTNARADGDRDRGTILKEYLRLKLIEFQKKNADLSHELARSQDERRQWEKELFLEIVEIVDAFENIFDNIEGKDAIWDKSAQMALKSFSAVHKRSLRLLERRGIEQIKFPENKAIFGLCQVVETKRDANLENETIISIVRKGYRRREGEILRLAEVITVSNN